jgi:hypothetical protein
MEQQKIGTDNLIKVLDLTIEIGNVADKVGHGTGMTKWAEVFQLYDEVAAMGSVDLKQVLPEFKDLDAVEKQMVYDHVKAKFDIVDDVLEAKIEECLGLAIDAVALFERASAVVKSFKAA